MGRANPGLGQSEGGRWPATARAGLRVPAATRQRLSAGAGRGIAADAGVSGTLALLRLSSVSRHAGCHRARVYPTRAEGLSAMDSRKRHQALLHRAEGWSEARRANRPMYCFALLLSFFFCHFLPKKPMSSPQITQPLATQQHPPVL